MLSCDEFAAPQNNNFLIKLIFNVLLIGKDADVVPPVVNRSDITQVCIITYSMRSKERKRSIASRCHVARFVNGFG